MTEEIKASIEKAITSNMNSLEIIVNNALREILQDVLPEYGMYDLIYASEYFYESQVDWE